LKLNICISLFLFYTLTAVTTIHLLVATGPLACCHYRSVAKENLGGGSVYKSFAPTETHGLHAHTLTITLQGLRLLGILNSTVKMVGQLLLE